MINLIGITERSACVDHGTFLGEIRNCAKSRDREILL